MTEIHGFKGVTLRVRPDIKNCHTLFLKENKIQKSDERKPAGKTIFVLNIPPYVTLENLKFGFEKVGKVTNVIFEKPDTREEYDSLDTPKDKYYDKKPPYIFKNGYIVFASTKCVAKALSLAEVLLFDSEGESVVVSGLTKYRNEYFENDFTEEELQADIDEFMKKYDAEQAKKKKKEKESVVDEEGWTVVTKHGPNAGFEQKESKINKIKEKEAKKKKDKELNNFYTFQIRESKMQHIVNLQKKFEDDKKKIEKIKSERKFHPLK